MSTLTTKRKVSKVTEKFLTLSKPEQRVKIAKDVILQLKKANMTAMQGTYMSASLNVDDDADAQSSVCNLDSCRACAMGFSMLSITKFANTLSVRELKEFSSDKKALSMLKNYFGLKEMAKIEYAFEGFYNNDGLAYSDFDYHLPEKEQEKCREFCRKYDDANERLRQIMKNIIANSGTFKP